MGELGKVVSWRLDKDEAEEMEKLLALLGRAWNRHDVAREAYKAFLETINGPAKRLMVSRFAQEIFELRKRGGAPQVKAPIALAAEKFMREHPNVAAFVDPANELGTDEQHKPRQTKPSQPEKPGPISPDVTHLDGEAARKAGYRATQRTPPPKGNKTIGGNDGHPHPVPRAKPPESQSPRQPSSPPQKEEK